MKDLISLPIYFQVMLASGYLAYIVAQQGRRKNEKTSDVLFGSLLFGLPSLGIWALLDSFSWPMISILVFIVTTSLATAIIWRKWLRQFWHDFAYEAGVSNEDGIPTTWERMTTDMSIEPTQIEVWLKNGRRYSCDNIQAFQKAAIPLFNSDEFGNIALYVTEYKISAESEWVKANTVLSEEWGDQITFIKNDEITSVEIRYKKIKKKH